MGNVIRFIFRTKLRYDWIDQFCILLGMIGIILWLVVGIKLLIK